MKNGFKRIKKQALIFFLELIANWDNNNYLCNPNFGHLC